MTTQGGEHSTPMTPGGGRGDVSAVSGSLDQLRGDFPRWYIWQGIAGMLYARLRRSSPPKVLRGHNVTVLRARLEQAELVIRLAEPGQLAAPGGVQGAGREPEP